MWKVELTWDLNNDNVPNSISPLIVICRLRCDQHNSKLIIVLRCQMRYTQSGKRRSNESAYFSRRIQNKQRFKSSIIYDRKWSSIKTPVHKYLYIFMSCRSFAVFFKLYWLMKKDMMITDFHNHSMKRQIVAQKINCYCVEYYFHDLSEDIEEIVPPHICFSLLTFQ